MARISLIRRRIFSSNPVSIVVCKCGLPMFVFSAGSVASVFSVVAFGGQQRGDPAIPRVRVATGPRPRQFVAYPGGDVKICKDL